MNLTDTPVWIGVAVLLVVVIASARQLRAPRRPPVLLASIIVLQLLAAALLFAVLQPPAQQVPASGQVVLLADAAAAGALPASDTAPRLLPEAADAAGGQRAPDLATALRQHPTTTLTLVGAGLAPRDRDAVLPADVRWQAAPAPTGWVQLQLPAVAAPGARFEVHAHAHGVTAAQAELLDPADAVVDRAAITGNGQVTLSGIARSEGRSVFQLRLLGADGHVVDSVPVPQQTVAAAPLRLRVRAGAPGAELKYLRRWATDSGLDVQVQADTGAGLSVGDNNVALDTGALARSDLLVLDERSLAALGGSQFNAVRGAVQDGLGLLVRLSAAPSASARQRLREFGLALQGDGSSRSSELPGDGEAAMLQARRGPLAASTLPTADGIAADRSSHGAALPLLEQLALQASNAQPLLHDRSGQPIGSWRDLGNGRVGLLPLTDSWRWVLAGRDDRHGELWSHVVSTLARAQPQSDPLWSPQALAWAGERQLLCGVPAALQSLQSLQADGRATPLQVDPASGSARCAAWWPRDAGWQRLQVGERELWRYVFDPATTASLHRQAMIDATTRTLGAHAAANPQATQQVPGPRWPWWLAFVLCASLLWWLERRPSQYSEGPKRLQKSL